MNSTKIRGDIGTSQVVVALTEQGFSVLAPIHSEHLRYDLVCDVAGRLLKVQCKYRSAEKGSLHIKASTVWSNASGSHTNPYRATDFDVIAVWCPEIRRVLFIPWTSSFKSIVIRTVPAGFASYYWWEDFLVLGEKMPTKRSAARKGRSASTSKREKENPLSKPVQVVVRSKATWPTHEDLRRLVWEIPSSSLAKQIGVSDKAVEKRCKRLGISKPPRGYWAKRASGAKENS
jgi:hypothetical protein